MLGIAVGNQCHLLAGRCPSEAGVQGCQRQALPLSQFRINGIVKG